MSDNIDLLDINRSESRKIPAREAGAEKERPQLRTRDAAPRKRRPEGARRPDGNRRPSGNRRPDGKMTAAQRKKRNARRKMRNTNNPFLKFYYRFGKYWTGLAIYAVILLIFGIGMLIYTDRCLVKYENSQAENAMKGFVKDFEKMVDDGTLVDNITLPASSEFEGKDIFSNMYMSEFSKSSDFTFEKDPASYNTEEPVYDIMADGKMVAKMTLEPSDQHVVLAILTVLDWKIKSIDPVFTATTNNYTVAIPEGYTFTVNDKEVSDKYKTGNVIMNPDFKNVSQYVSMPMTVEYKLTGFVNKPNIKVFNKDGKEVGANVDDKGNVSLGASGDSGNMPEDRKEDSLNMAKTWDNFLTNDLSGAGHGLAKVQEFLIPDSYYWNLAKEYSVSPDITFISDHTMSANPYTNVVVDNYVEYGEDCYSCHIVFTKNMRLSSSTTAKSEIDSTFYFVKHDGKWTIVDMIATTK